ncbi:MAG: amidohydrolase [Candidatus Azobacteroides sp.]|nr:amidohydrolase [Candidatus Azobacteroides sp.]
MNIKKPVHSILPVLFLLCSLPLTAQQHIGKETILTKIQEIDTYIREIRGYLHEHPEVSSQEFETARFLQAELAKLDIPVTKVPGTGFYAILDTHKPGKTIGLRTDIDALPIQESPFNLKQDKKWTSRNPGVSHACGHDGHMAILLGTIKILNDLKDHLHGKVIFIFEEGEETNTGIDPMVEALKSLEIDAIYGNHLYSALETGKIFIREGAIMAGTGTVAFNVTGKGGHGSRPDLSVNPVFAAANVLTGIASAWSNQLDVTKTVTLGITQVHGGEAYNVIPDSVYIGGTIRFFDLQEAEKAFSVLRKVSEYTAGAHNCSVKFHSRMGIKLHPVINDNELTMFTRNAIQEIYPEKIVSGEENIWYTSETFAKYRELAPTVFLLIGIKNEETGSGAEHHTSQFDLDEEALQYGVGSMVQVTVQYLSSPY